ncbi:hypothetical protein DAEQUDRAFT_738614 [Daedalea quercina L-15889]|uniref:Uncharacterized protein n=1 Tax=Daedalea quercina L-15889 TaxID=1314783 RepID=A0A165PRX0_9APHY|nr:hypothetical protein DAEQUDRAFT_738614 [Daedalea quercina L-15889]
MGEETHRRDLALMIGDLAVRSTSTIATLIWIPGIIVGTVQVATAASIKVQGDARSPIPPQTHVLYGVAIANAQTSVRGADECVAVCLMMMRPGKSWKGVTICVEMDTKRHVKAILYPPGSGRIGSPEA